MTKIIHALLGKANPDSMNGVNKVVHYLATEQTNAGYKVEVWGLVRGQPTHTHNYGLRIVGTSRNRFHVVPELTDAIKDLPDDTVAHLHSVFLPELFAISRQLRKRKIPWVITPHGGYGAQSLQKNRLAKRLYFSLFERGILREAQALHALSQNEADDIRALLNHDRIVVVPNGQDLDALKHENVGLRRDIRPVFGFCGRLAARHKGLDILIDGFARYRRDGGRGELWLLGDGPDRETLQSQARANHVRESVRFLGSMFGEQKLNHVSAMDVFIHTSRWEGLPTAVLEAAGLSIPLLVSRPTNMAEFIQRYNCGLVLETNTPANVATALHLFAKRYEREGLQSMGYGSLAMVREAFDWSKIAKTLFTAAYGPNR